MSATRSPGATREVDAAQERRARRSSHQTPRGAHAQRLAAARAAATAGARRRLAGPPAPVEQAVRAQRGARLLDPPGGGRSPARGNSRAAGVCSAGALSAAHSRKRAAARRRRRRPSSQRDHAVGRGQAALEAVLGQDDRRAPFLVEPPQQPDELVAGDRVELGGRLVEQHQPRAARRAPRPARRAAARRR